MFWTKKTYVSYISRTLGGGAFPVLRQRASVVISRTLGSNAFPPRPERDTVELCIA